jgi:general secretion pathway protein D
VNAKTNLAIAVLALSITVSKAQFDFGTAAPSASSSKPWEGLKLPKKSVKLDFRNSGIDMIIAFFEKASGVSIVKDPALTDRVTVTSAKQVPLSQAFQILSTTLSLKGYEMVKEGSLLVIKKRQERPQNAAPAFDPSMFANMQAPQSELRVYPVKFAAASQLARVVNEVFAAQQSGFPFPGGGGAQFLFGGAGGGGRFGQNRGGFPGGGNFRLGGNGAPSVRASSDDFSNSVVVNAPRDQQKDVAELIKQLDKQTDAPQKSVVYTLKFASATETQQTITNLLTANAPKGRGQTSQNQGGGGGGFGFFFGGGNQNRNNQALVTADIRSNSLVVTATDENHEIIDRVIKEIDKDIPIETTTFVLPLANARADDVAGLLNQAFGQRQGTGVNRGGNVNNRNANNPRNTNRNNRNQNLNLGGEQISNNELLLNLQDPNADSGELLTNVGVAQFGGFFGGFGQQQNNQNRNQQPARDANGRIINVQDLTGQVTTIADPNTNSIIVVTTPQGAEILRSIVTQLDRIPEQVMIETLIVEATLDESTKLGFEWDFTQAKAFNQTGVTGNASTIFPEAANTAQAGFRYTVTGGNLDVVLNALKTDNRFQILSTPRIFTSNNVEAQINISQSVPYVISSRQDVNGNFTFNFAFEDVGIILTVTPRITSNGYVTMDVVQTANDLQGFTDFNAPIINQRQADTTVSVKDGETIVLGGIIRSTVNSRVRKVPILGDIPLLGELFRSSTKEKAKTELIVFLTPRVVRDSDDARLLRDRVRGQLSKENKAEVDKQLGKNAPPPVKGSGDKKDEKKQEEKKTGNGDKP